MFSRRHPYLFFVLIFSSISASAAVIIVISLLFVFGERDSGYDDLKAGGEKVGIIEIKGVIADSLQRSSIVKASDVFQRDNLSDSFFRFTRSYCGDQ